jgi:HlyD family secretion protein
VPRPRPDRAAADPPLRLLPAGTRAEDNRLAEAQPAAAAADASAIDAEIRAAQIDLDRFEALLAANAGARKQRDDAQARVEVARERRRAAEERVRAAQEMVARARRGSRPQELDAARARVAGAEAQIAVLEEQVRDATVTAPVAGIVTQTLANAGEIVARGAPIAVITDLDRAWANLFVPEPLVPRILLGQAATVFTDAGGAGIAGTVTFISPRAEFTPRNVQTAEERSKLVYRIKVSVDNSAGVLKPGMPVDAELALK